MASSHSSSLQNSRCRVALKMYRRLGAAVQVTQWIPHGPPNTLMGITVRPGGALDNARPAMESGVGWMHHGKVDAWPNHHPAVTPNHHHHHRRAVAWAGTVTTAPARRRSLEGRCGGVVFTIIRAAMVGGRHPWSGSPRQPSRWEGCASGRSASTSTHNVDISMEQCRQQQAHHDAWSQITTTLRHQEPAAPWPPACAHAAPVPVIVLQTGQQQHNGRFHHPVSRWLAPGSIQPHTVLPNR